MWHTGAKQGRFLVWELPCHERMPSLAELTLWLLTTLVEVFRRVSLLRSRLVPQIPFFNFYLLLSVTINTGRYAVLSHFGFHSSEYAYFYYFTDVVLTLSLFICISELCVRLVGDRMTLRGVVLWSASALLATALFSFSAVSPWGYRVATRFVPELSRNILFACCLGLPCFGFGSCATIRRSDSGPVR